MMETVTCPACEGTGEREWESPKGPHRNELITCNVCDGWGRCSGWYADRWRLHPTIATKKPRAWIPGANR